MTETLGELEFVRTKQEIGHVNIFNIVKSSTGTIVNLIKTLVSFYIISSFKTNKEYNKQEDSENEESSNQENKINESFMWMNIKQWKDNLKSKIHNLRFNTLRYRYNKYLFNHIRPTFNKYEYINDEYRCVNNADSNNSQEDDKTTQNIHMQPPNKPLNNDTEVICTQNNSENFELEDSHELVEKIDSLDFKTPINILKKGKQKSLKLFGRILNNNTLLNSNQHKFIKRRLNYLNYRAFSTLEEDYSDDTTLEQSDQELEDEFQEFCRDHREYVVLDRNNETGNLNSFLSRLSDRNPDVYLTKYKPSNLSDLDDLERYSNTLYTFVSCGLHVNPDDIKRIFHELYEYYFEKLNKNEDLDKPSNKIDHDKDNDISQETDNGTSKKTDNDISNETNQLERLSRALGSVILSYCESGVFKEDSKKVAEMLERFLFGDMVDKFLRLSSGKLINSVLFMYSVSQFFEKDYDSSMERVYNDVIESISKKELSMDMSDLYYLKLSTKFISNQNPSLVKKLSEESISFLSNVVFQDYIRDKEPHGLEDSVPQKIKDIDSNVEGGVFNIGPYTFTHVSLSNKNVYLLNKPYYYFNSNLKLGRREYLNWMDSFLKSSGWNIIHL